MKETTYHVDSQFVKMTKFGFWFFASVAALSLVVTFIPDEDGAFSLASVIVMLMCTLGLSGFALYGYRTLKSFPNFSISLDFEGLWYASKTKNDGLIPWKKVKGIKEKSIAQKLELLGDDGLSLIDVHYQLQGFNELRDTLTHMVRTNYTDIKEPMFKKGLGHHFFNILALAGFTGLAAYGLNNFSLFLFLGVILIVFLGLYEYCFSYHKVYISDGNLIANSILKKKIYDLNDVKDVAMLDDFNKGSRIPNVTVIFRDESSLKIPSMGRSAIEICILLKNLVPKV